VPSISSSASIPENVGINNNDFPVKETSRGPVPAPAGTPVKTRFTQKKPVDTSFDYQEDEVLTAFSNLMEVARGFKPESSPASAPGTGFRLTSASVVGLRPTSGGLRPTSGGLRPTSGGLRPTSAPVQAFRPTLRTRITTTTKPKTAQPRLIKKIRNNPKARGFSLSRTSEIEEPIISQVKDDLKAEVINGNRRVMKRRRLRKPGKTRTATTTTSTITTNYEELNTIDTADATPTNTKINPEERRRLLFPPRDFMERVRGSESKQRNSKTLDKKRFKVRRRKADVLKPSKQRLSIPRSSSGRSLPDFSNLADASLAGHNILPEQHTNAHQGHQNPKHPFVSDINMSTGSYSISYGK